MGGKRAGVLVRSNNSGNRLMRARLPRRAFLWLACALAACLLGSGGSMSAASSEERTAYSCVTCEADHDYHNRGNLENVRKALSLMRAEAAAHPQNYDAWWRIAEYDCYLARHTKGKEKTAILEEGIAAGRKAEALHSNRPEGHFWTGTDEGLLAEERGLWGGLSLANTVRNELQTVMKIDPDYDEYGAERLLGRFYYEAPFFKGGDKQLSVHLLEDCLRRYPSNSLTMLYLADSYCAVGRSDSARALLEEILRLKQDPMNRLSLATYQARARRKLQRHFHLGP